MRAGSRAGRSRLRSLLVVAQVATTATAVAVAVLLTQTFNALLRAERGFEVDGVLTTGLSLSGPRYREPSARSAFVDALIADLEVMPGVSHVAVASQLPLTGTGALSAVSLEATNADPEARPSSDVRSVTPDFFGLLSIPLTSGRLFDASDRERNVVLVSDALARRAWGTRSPLGQRFRFGLNPATPLWTVIGTVGDIRGTSLDQPMSLMAYVPFPLRSGSVTLLAKTHDDPVALAPAIATAIGRADAEMPIDELRTMHDVLDTSLAPRRFQLQLVAAFAAITALLTGLGIYGTLAYTVAQRQAEIGVRLALGETPGSVVRHTVMQAMRLAVLGLALALPLALAAKRLIGTLIAAENQALMPAFGIAALLVAGTALAAATIPAARAGRVEPVTALRTDS